MSPGVATPCPAAPPIANQGLLGRHRTFGAAGVAIGDDADRFNRARLAEPFLEITLRRFKRMNGKDFNSTAESKDYRADNTRGNSMIKKLYVGY
jgi:hypothetical protein